jgi:hypothetical protein
LDAGFENGEAIRMIGPDRRLIAIGFYNSTENFVQPGVVLV